MAILCRCVQQRICSMQGGYTSRSLHASIERLLTPATLRRSGQLGKRSVSYRFLGFRAASTGVQGEISNMSSQEKVKDSDAAEALGNVLQPTKLTEEQQKQEIEKAREPKDGQPGTVPPSQEKEGYVADLDE